MKLTILMPVYNELAHLDPILSEVVTQLHRSPLTGKELTSAEIICIDDASSDGSREWLQELVSEFPVKYGRLAGLPCEYRLLLQETNQGKGAALQRGFEASRGDFVLIQDADLEYSPSDYDALLKPLLSDQADAVYGSRFLKGRDVRWLSFIQRFANLFLTWLFNFVSATQVTDVETCYKVLRGDVARSLRLNSKRFGIELELTARLSRINARIAEVPIRYRPRTAAEGKKIGMMDGIAALFHIFRYNVLDTKPFKSGQGLQRFRLRPRTRTVALLVFASALLVRLGFVAQWFQTPYAHAPLLDALAYDEWAKSILNGQFLRDRAFYQSPLYPYVLAGLYRLFGPDFLFVSIFQAGLGALTCSLLTVVTIRSFGEWAGGIAGLLAIFYRPLIFYTAPAMKETLSLFLLTVFILCAARALTNSRKRDYLSAGFVLGLTALTRGNALILLPALSLVFLFHKGFSKVVFSRLAIFGFATGLAIAPATLHNFVVSRDFVLLNYTSGFNFYMGSSSTTTGANAYPKDVSSEPGKEELDVTRIAEASLGRALKPSEVSHFWFQRGLDYVWTHPMHQLASVLNKTLFFWNDYEQPDNYDIHFISSEFPTLLGWPLVGFGLLSVFSAFGFVISWRDQSIASRALFVMGFTYAGSVLLYYVTDRYRLPIVLFMFPFAGASGPALWKLFQQRQFFSLALPTLGAFPFALLAFQPLPIDHDRLNAFNWGVISSAYSDQKMDMKAVEALKKGLALNPKAVDSEALIKASTSLERLGDHQEAGRLLKFACETHPNDALNPYNYGRFKFEHGDPQGALTLFKKARSMAPWNHLPYIGLAVSYLQLKRFDEATSAVREGLKIAPSSPELRTAAQQLSQLSLKKERLPSSTRPASR